MRIAVLGAAGAMAQVVLRDLLEFVPHVANIAEPSSTVFFQASRDDPTESRMDVRRQPVEIRSALDDRRQNF